jgi:Spy/CpxP family protein refolding chaperone
MKRKITSIGKMMMVLSGLVLSVSLMAQRGYGTGRYAQNRQGTGRYCQAMPDLTDEQEQKINDLRTAHMKEMNSCRSDLSIKRAELQKLQTADNADMNKINSKIDEIGKIGTEMSKSRAAHLQKVRALLTDEQRVFFDSRHNRRKGPGMRMGRQGSQGFRDGTGPDRPRGFRDGTGANCPRGLTQ